MVDGEVEGLRERKTEGKFKKKTSFWEEEKTKTAFWPHFLR